MAADTRHSAAGFGLVTAMLLAWVAAFSLGQCQWVFVCSPHKHIWRRHPSTLCSLQGKRNGLAKPSLTSIIWLALILPSCRHNWSTAAHLVSISYQVMGVACHMRDLLQTPYSFPVHILLVLTAQPPSTAICTFRSQDHRICSTTSPQKLFPSGHKPPQSLIKSLAKDQLAVKVNNSRLC